MRPVLGTGTRTAFCHRNRPIADRTLLIKYFFYRARTNTSRAIGTHPRFDAFASSTTGSKRGLYHHNTRTGQREYPPLREVITPTLVRAVLFTPRLRAGFRRVGKKARLSFVSVPSLRLNPPAYTMVQCTHSTLHSQHSTLHSKHIALTAYCTHSILLIIAHCSSSYIAHG